MNAHTLIYFCLSSLLIAALPGPAMMLVMQGAMTHGWRKGVRITLGILLADAVLLLAVCLGLGGLMASSPTVLWLMNVVSSVYLVYLGAKSLLEIRGGTQALPDTPAVADWQTGWLITIINPKTIVFLLAYFPQFIQRQAVWSETVQLWVLSGCFLLMVAVVMLVYAVAAHQARHILANRYVRLVMSLGFGWLLIGIGLESLWAA